MAEDREAELRDFLEAVWRHPWARFEFLQVECGLTEFRARRARRQAVDLSLVEVERIATRGQPRPPARYSLTPAGAHRMGVPLHAVDGRGSTLLASPHLERVRGLLLGAAPLRERLVWSISPWRPGGGVILDALACVRNSRGREVPVAFAVPPESAAASWWYLELLRSWFRLSRSGEGAGAALAVLGLPFDPMALPLLLCSGRRGRNQATHAAAPMYFLPGGEERGTLDSAEAWLRLPELGWSRVCPWDEPTLAGSPSGPRSYMGGRVPAGPRGKLVREWVEANRHPVAQALRSGLLLTHGESSLVEALLLYPAFSAEELALVTGLRSRSVRRALQRLMDLGLVEALPLFAEERRAVLTSRGLDLLAFKAMQTPARFRLRRAWPTDHGALTRSPRHMQYVLAFMLALRRGGRLASWDLVRARYEYCVAVAPGDLTRPRRVELVPDSGGILSIDGREVPFWLEIDRGTRNGVRLTRQLEKYILARFGYAASDPLPLLLYVVAEGGESRARLVARRLVDLSGRYRLRRIPAILITTWHLLTDGDLSRPPEPLRAVWRLPFRWMEYIPPVPPMPVPTDAPDGRVMRRGQTVMEIPAVAEAGAGL